MAQVERRAAFLGVVVAGIGALRPAAGEDVRGAGTALSQVDGMRPGVRNTGGHTVRIALSQLRDQSVVPAIQTRVDHVEAGVTGIHPVLPHVDGRRKAAREGPAAHDVVSNYGSRCADVDIVDRGQVQTAAPDSRHCQGQVLGQLPLECEIRLLGIRSTKVFSGHIQAHRTHWRVITARTGWQHNGEHRTSRFIGGRV